MCTFDVKQETADIQRQNKRSVQETTPAMIPVTFCHDIIYKSAYRKEKLLWCRFEDPTNDILSKSFE